MVPPEGGPKDFEALILLAPKAPKQNFGCQPHIGRGGGRGEGGPGGGYPPSSYDVRPFYYITGGRGWGCT